MFHTAFWGAELSISDSSGWISRLGKQYQNTWKQTYDQYILIWSYNIQHRLELKFFHFAQFLLNAHRAKHLLRKLDDCLPSQIAQIILKSKIEACPVNAGHHTAFKHRISFATDLAAWLKSIQNHARHRFKAFARRHLKSLCCSIWIWADHWTPCPWTGPSRICDRFCCNFGWNRFRIMPDIVSKVLRAAIWSCCVVQFEFEQTPFLGQVVDLDLLLCTGFDSEHVVLFLCHIFTQRPMNDCKIEQSDGRCSGWQQLFANSMENFISHEKNHCRHCQIFTKD